MFIILKEFFPTTLYNNCIVEHKNLNAFCVGFFFIFFVCCLTVDYKMDDCRRVSEAMYVGLCRQIGTPTEVVIRRELMDVDEMIHRRVYLNEGVIFVQSGSYREGFIFKSSDIDVMFWPTRCKVICGMSNFNVSDICSILMEHSEAPPGFVRLKLLNYTPGEKMVFLQSIENHINGFYLSSKKFRDKCYEIICSGTIAKNVQPHGPCNSFHAFGFENDFGGCIACQYWPQTATPWITRCQLNRWPTEIVLNDIIPKGCHVMPIGNLGSDESELEWRLSFTQAEQKIIYSFNHTQFLCYGILKIFLNEILCLGKRESLICSYFLKTILFWEIQNYPDNIIWCPSNLFCCFWMCFKRLCKCVFDACCPNFFVPENNMFMHKVVGASREALLSNFMITMK